MLLRCELADKRDHFEAICLELGVAAYGSTVGECKKNLEEAVTAYIETVRKFPDKKFVVRPVPFYSFRKRLFDWRVARQNARKNKPTIGQQRYTFSKRLPEEMIPIGA